MNDINRLIKSYYSWLKAETTWKPIHEWVEITSPYLDRNNDYIQIYLKKINKGYLLTDDGATIEGLLMEGCKLDSPKRQQLLQLTLRGYGVDKEDNKLQIKAASDSDFPICKHSLIQAILAVNDMFYMASSYVASLFFEDVQKWLDDSKIRYSERIQFKGLSNYSRNFDFVIPKSPEQPERLIKTINNPDKNSIDSIIMDWEDTKSVRSPNSKLYTFINDSKKNMIESDNKTDDMLNSQTAIRKASLALKNYRINSVLWSERDKIKEELAA